MNSLKTMILGVLSFVIILTGGVYLSSIKPDDGFSVGLMCGVMWSLIFDFIRATFNN